MRMRRDLRLSQQQEKRVARRHYGRVTKGSGNGWIHKQDVETEGVLWEMKRTSSTQITLKAADLEELRKNAILSDCLPVMHVEIGTRRCVVLLEADFETLREDAGRDQGLDAVPRLGRLG
jgi:hypothetical protein